MDNKRLSKSEMLALSQREYDLLQATYARITPEQKIIPNAIGEWSIKDIIAHMIYWNRHPMRVLDTVMRGERFVYPATIDEINAQVVAESRSASLASIEAEFAQSYGEAFQAITDLPESILEPDGEVEKLLGYAVWELFESNIFGHYAEHRADIEGWFAQLKS